MKLPPLGVLLPLFRRFGSAAHDAMATLAQLDGRPSPQLFAPTPNLGTGRDEKKRSWAGGRRHVSTANIPRSITPANEKSR
jgi:hypothetical protein